MGELDSHLKVLKAKELTGVSISPLFEEAKVVKRQVVELTQPIRDEINALSDSLESVRQNAKASGLAEAQKEATATLLAAKREYEQARQSAEKDAVDFAFALASKIISKQVELAPDTIATIVGSLLEEVQDRRELVVWIHPDDKETLTRHRKWLTDSVGGVPIRFDAREDIDRGGCIIETASGRIDGRLETQLRILREEMEQ